MIYPGQGALKALCPVLLISEKEAEECTERTTAI